VEHAASNACPQLVRALRISRNQHAAKRNAELRATDDFHEDTYTLLEKRKPVWAFMLLNQMMTAPPYATLAARALKGCLQRIV
jgi:hypothetical protein